MEYFQAIDITLITAFSRAPLFMTVTMTPLMMTVMTPGDIGERISSDDKGRDIETDR